MLAFWTGPIANGLLFCNTTSIVRYRDISKRGSFFLGSLFPRCLSMLWCSDGKKCPEMPVVVVVSRFALATDVGSERKLSRDKNGVGKLAILPAV